MIDKTGVKNQIDEKERLIAEKDKRISEKDKLIEEKSKEISELKERITYLQADFDNLRKYFDKEKQNVIMLSNKDLIKDMLAVLDDLDSAVNNTKDEGIRMIHGKIMKLLNSKGLEPIKCVGCKFDPCEHEALMIEGEDETVTQELQKGYKLQNVVIRPSKVKIGGGV
ncbi:MAG TPA: nucleotide exchange factor GrpE [Candidatus Nanoarchaeia archaeon]|nr:nucleotide exchange factor GrpE [Candidatus Nanoarchaeia archaeon]